MRLSACIGVVAALGASGCSSSEATIDEDAALAVAFPDLTVGPVESFPDGRPTEVVVPRHVFVTYRNDAVLVFGVEDPNNGCKMRVVDDDLRVEYDVPTAATYWDPCHGNTYDADGEPLDADDPQSMRALDAIIRGGDVVLRSPLANLDR